MAPSGSEFVRLLTTHSVTEGYLARGRLEVEGIPVLLKGESEGPYRMGPVHLWIPAELEVQARLILTEIREGSVALTDAEDLSAETDWSQAEREPHGRP
jgi:Putative prokaryotic signal transducing protein